MPPAHSSPNEPMVPIAQRPTIARYLRDIWSRRHFAVTMPLEELRSQHLNTALGHLWHLLNPALLVGIYFLIFGLLLDADRGVDNYIPFLAVGVIIYYYSQRTILAGAKSITGNLGLIQSMAFPRMILPLSATIGHTLALLPAIAVMLIVCILTGELPRASWLVLAPVLLAQALLNLGVASAVARIAHKYRDVENMLPFVFRLLFYASGILYSVEYLVANEVIGPAGKLVFELNPFYAVVSVARWALLSTPVSSTTIFAFIFWCIAALMGGIVYFVRGEAEYGA